MEVSRVSRVNIHLTDTTAKLDGKFSVKTLLENERKREYLVSYAYRQQLKQWQELWMQIHLAGHSAPFETEQQLRPTHNHHLASYADLGELANTISVTTATADRHPCVIIDSGAFTAFTTGKIINPQDYAAWSLEFEQEWSPKMRSLHFMNLDVIGDQEGTWKNQALLEKLGMHPIPIVTQGACLKHLDYALRHYPYIALGGLVPLARQPKALKAWLDCCFVKIVAHYKATGQMPRIHLLGITTDWVLKRYPCYSSDSSAWVACLRFGRGGAAGIKKVPRYKESGAAMAATLHVLRTEIKRFQKMEQEATALWKSRGIVFDE